MGEKIEVTIVYECDVEVEYCEEFGVVEEVEVEYDLEDSESGDEYADQEWDNYANWGNDTRVPCRGWYEKDGEKAVVDFDDFQCKNGEVTGSGSDPVGEFYLSGECNTDGYFAFAKQYIGAHQLMYCGQVKGKVWCGRWELAGNTSGTFNIKPGFQNWKGYFEQDGREKMALDMYVGDTGISGQGCDDTGFFSLQGENDGYNVFFAKSYWGQHTVHYSGKLKDDGFKIKGKWVNTGGLCEFSGKFKLKRTD